MKYGRRRGMREEWAKPIKFIISIYETDKQYKNKEKKI